MESIYFTPEMKKYWIKHSTIIDALFEGEDDKDSIPRDELPGLSDAQWRLFKDIIENERPVFKFDYRGTPRLNRSKGHSQEMINDLLDYIGYNKPKTMRKEFRKFVLEHQLNAPAKKLGHGITGATRTAIRRKPMTNAAKIAKLVKRYGGPNNYNSEDVEIALELEEENIEEAEKAKQMRLRMSQKAKKYAYANINNNSALRNKPIGKKSATIKKKNKGKRASTSKKPSRKGAGAGNNSNNENNK